MEFDESYPTDVVHSVLEWNSEESRSTSYEGCCVARESWEVKVLADRERRKVQGRVSF